MKLLSGMSLRTSHVLLASIWFAVASPSRGEGAADFHSALQPLEEGVPEVAVARLQYLLGSTLTWQERQVAMLKLAEALVVTGNAENALKILDDSRIRALPRANFCRAQAYASLGRWQEALAAYSEVASDKKSPLGAEALFGKAEALRALGRKDEALQTFPLLFADPRWSLPARFRCTELFIDKHDPASAGNVLSKAQPQSML
jgi:tetratricopeptide (TPR) repeat protein